MKDFEIDKGLLVYIFTLFTGLRSGEISALTYADIDIENKVINVNKSLSKVTVDGVSKLITSKPKTKAGIRTIPIINGLYYPIIDHMERELEKHQRIDAKITPESYFFTSLIATPLRASQLGANWNKYQLNADIEPVTFHGIRHTFCTLLAEKDVHIKKASVLMGHTDIATTAKIYTHIDDQQKREAITVLDDVFGAKKPSIEN